MDENAMNGGDEAMHPDMRHAPPPGPEAPRKPRRSGWLRRLVMVRRPRAVADGTDPLERRRADSHPDAPPRPPLMASRDLPPPPPTGTISSAPHEARTDQAPFVADSEAVFTEYEPDAEPNLPDIFSGLEEPSRHPTPDYLSEFVALPPIAENGTATEVSLTSLLIRFEHGLSRRFAIAEARSAGKQLAERMIFVPENPAMQNVLRSLRPGGSVAPAPHGATGAETAATMYSPANDRADAVETELEIALGALRRLAEQSRR